MLHSQLIPTLGQHLSSSTFFWITHRSPGIRLDWSPQTTESAGLGHLRADALIPTPPSEMSLTNSQKIKRSVVLLVVPAICCIVLSLCSHGIYLLPLNRLSHWPPLVCFWRGKKEKNFLTLFTLQELMKSSVLSPNSEICQRYELIDYIRPTSEITRYSKYLPLNFQLIKVFYPCLLHTMIGWEKSHIIKEMLSLL